MPVEKMEMLSAVIGAQSLSVDRAQNIVHGVVLAQEGSFKTKGRGAFDQASLKTIKAAINKMPSGMPSRFAHPEMFKDAIGTRVGRYMNPQMSHVAVQRDGKQVLLHALRADLHFYKFALKNSRDGGTPYGVQLMDMLEEDPGSLSTSLVLSADMEDQIDPKTKRQALDADGQPLPPLWRPKQVLASDFVDRGEAVDAALSAAQQLAASEAGLADTQFEVGDMVEWLMEDEDELSACTCQGTILQIATEGSLTIPATELELEAPCALIGCDPDGDDDVDEWYLVALDKLSLSDGSDLETPDDMAAAEKMQLLKAGIVNNLNNDLTAFETKTTSRSVAELETILAENG